MKGGAPGLMELSKQKPTIQREFVGFENVTGAVSEAEAKPMMYSPLHAFVPLFTVTEVHEVVSHDTVMLRSQAGVWARATVARARARATRERSTQERRNMEGDCTGETGKRKATSGGRGGLPSRHITSKDE